MPDVYQDARSRAMFSTGLTLLLSHRFESPPKRGAMDARQLGHLGAFEDSDELSGTLIPGAAIVAARLTALARCCTFVR